MKTTLDLPDSLVKQLVSTDPKTGLPLIVCPQAAAPGEEITPHCIAEILLAQEAEWHHAAGR